MIAISGHYYDKVAALNNIAPPGTKKLFSSFLGLISFYKLIIPQASKYTGSLSDFLKKDVRERTTLEIPTSSAASYI